VIILLAGVIVHNTGVAGSRRRVERASHGLEYTAAIDLLHPSVDPGAIPMMTRGRSNPQELLGAECSPM
jgi:hypothetical protein